MQEIPGTRIRGQKERGSLRRFNRWFWNDFVLEVVGEGLLAITGCLLFAGALAAAVWGYGRAPKSTIAFGLALILLFAYGVVVLVGTPTRPKGILVSIAVTFCVFVAVWAVYVLQYCACS